MCRILFAVGEGEKVKSLVDTLVKASENDPYKAKRKWGEKHKDGWGYLLLVNNSVVHYKSEKPIFGDLGEVEKLKERLEEFVVLLAHTRAASQGEVRLFNVHPYHFSTERGFEFWIFHNGDLNKEKLVELGKFNGEVLKNASDSYTMGVYLSRKLEGIEKEQILRRFRELKGTVNSALNTASLFIDANGKVRGFITAYMKDDLLKHETEYNYYRLLKLKKDLFAVVSSTFELYSDLPFEHVENGTAFYIKIEPKEMKFEVEEIKL
ncbi:class II glutamine amidotransferase [Thermococcus paralvinellae]|uniref:Glutamine amidotransferase type-2 domain-containing protein n=1 Tax=Thermococcus paralvinellae TaxID=582419 RepID=W0I0B4_9EURY|nr:class II glutamine amidotransferase [Thermococcus paralvinellae]AHF79476.1 Hypothetical protein TES1_0079 [Thermococcus paralvinellae]